jgi:hypothetical protein|tara:strand:+ start:4559 stop:4729 length:171 start_codon:yes stop_codon:yes gene_type:complete
VFLGAKKARPFLQTTWQVWLLGGKLLYIGTITFNHGDFKHFLVYGGYQLEEVDVSV